MNRMFLPALPDAAWRSAITIVGCAAVLAGCASMSRQECLQADWYAVGERDAGRGYPMNRMADHAEACAEFGVRPSAREYEAGYKAGIPLYCNDAVGWSEGRAGGRYQGICPPDLERGFLRGYRLGREIHQLGQRLENLDRRMDYVAEELADPGLSKERRRELRQTYRDLRREVRYLERSLADARADARRQGYY